MGVPGTFFLWTSFVTFLLQRRQPLLPLLIVGRTNSAFIPTTQICGLVEKQHHASENSSARRSSALVLFSQLYQTQIAEDIQSRYLKPLLEVADLDISKVNIETLSDPGFCNNVYRITETTSKDESSPSRTLVAKLFSDLAKKRMDPSRSFGEIDELLDQQNLGPRVLAHTQDALLMEYIDGKVLTESMILDSNDGLALCQSVGHTLGTMHNLKGDLGPNMLWHALDVMLSNTDTDLKVLSDSETTWTVSRLKDAISGYQGRIEAMNLPCVAVGHGDFKLSNVMLQSTGDVRFIDFELSGSHYRGYDLAKFFRSARQSSHHLRELHQEAFWESYHRRTNPIADTSTASAIAELQWEAQLLEPITWLEAASFFLCMATLDAPTEKDKWTGMAKSRLSSYEKMIIGAES